MTSSEEVLRLLRAGRVVLRREHPQLAGAIDWLVKTGRITAVLPGAYAATEEADDVRIKVLAITRLDRDAVVTHHAAARLSFWPELRSPAPVTVAVAARRARRDGFVFQCRRIPADLVEVRSGIRLTTPALTALDLSTLEQSEPLDTALRKRQVTPRQLQEALTLTRGRRGNAERWQLALESSTNPWSYAERCAHRLLRRFGVRGWVANHPVRMASGAMYFLDIAFVEQLVVVEIDGRLHRQAGAFESDLHRQNELHQAGWIVLRFTTAQLAADPAGFINAIQRVVDLQRHRLTG